MAIISFDTDQVVLKKQRTQRSFEFPVLLDSSFYKLIFSFYNILEWLKSTL